MINNFVNNQDYNKNLTLDITPKPLLPQYQPQVPQMTRRLADQIFALPGLTFQPQFKSHAGYLNASPGNYLFYWFYESQGDSSVDPVRFSFWKWMQDLRRIARNYLKEMAMPIFVTVKNPRYFSGYKAGQVVRVLEALWARLDPTSSTLMEQRYLKISTRGIK